MPSPRQAPESLQQLMDDAVEKTNKTVGRLLPETDLPEDRLFEAMRYGVLNGGKRLRPFLVLQSAKLFNVDPKRSRRVAAALEFVHCYSLIHDDLPAMDNADLRRGEPSTHKAFDEATAILAGDALLTLAFEILSDPETHEDPRVRCELVNALAKAAGGHGMCGGQMLDLLGETEEFDLGTISRLQRMKTESSWPLPAKPALFSANPIARTAKRFATTPTILALPFRSQTIFLMSKAMWLSLAKIRAKTKMPAKPPLCPPWAKMPPKCGRKCWYNKPVVTFMSLATAPTP